MLQINKCDNIHIIYSVLIKTSIMSGGMLARLRLEAYYIHKYIEGVRHKEINKVGDVGRNGRRIEK